MILLRPTINFYYDNIVDGIPVPNGVKDYKFGKRYSRIPFMSATERRTNKQVRRNTYFYNVMKVNNVNVNIYTKGKFPKNTYYPLELEKYDSGPSLVEIIPSKTLQRLKKGNLKVLILFQQYVGNHILMRSLKDRVDKLIRHGVPIKNIHVVLGDLRISYQELFKDIKVYGFDWWQIAHQITCKSRYGIEDYHWVSMESYDMKLTEEQIKKEQFDLDKWHPLYLFSAYTGKKTLQNTSLISELKIRNLLNLGEYSFNLFGKDKNYINKIVIDPYRGQEYKQEKEKIINELAKHTKVLDYTGDVIENNTRIIDAKNLHHSVVSIISDSFIPTFDKSYLSETNALFASRTVWQHLATGHPFMVIGSLGIHRYLNSEGYFSPTEIFNELFDRISNLAVKTTHIIDELEKLSNMQVHEIQAVIDSTKEFMAVNKKKFYERSHTWKFYELFTELENER